MKARVTNLMQKRCSFFPYYLEATTIIEEGLKKKAAKFLNNQDL